MSKAKTQNVTANRYVQIIEQLFEKHYRAGLREIHFEREEIEHLARKLNIELPKNLGDLVYTFRYRVELPASIKSRAPEGEHWVIKGVGRSRYCFALTKQSVILPNKMLAETKVPEATPGIIEKYALSDEQALLAKVRYNRLIDIFTGITCYSLQSHLRTSVTDVGQVETDEVYVGVDRQGVHYVIPVQAKGGKDRLSTVQIEQDFAMCMKKFANLVCRPIATQFMNDELIAMFLFELNDGVVAISSEKHYRLVAPDEIDVKDLKVYQSRSNASE